MTVFEAIWFRGFDGLFVSITVNQLYERGGLRLIQRIIKNTFSLLVAFFRVHYIAVHVKHRISYLHQSAYRKNGYGFPSLVRSQVRTTRVRGKWTQDSLNNQYLFFCLCVAATNNYIFNVNLFFWTWIPYPEQHQDFSRCSASYFLNKVCLYFLLAKLNAWSRNPTDCRRIP